MVSGVELFLAQAIAFLPREIGELILKDVPDAGLARIRLSCQSWRACVDRVTSWPSIYRIFQVFNSIRVEHITAKPGLAYAIDFDAAMCTTFREGGQAVQSPMFPELRLRPTGNIQGTYQVSPTLFVCIPSSSVQDPASTSQFRIGTDRALTKGTLALFGETIKTLSSNFQQLPWLVIGDIVQRRNLVQIHLSCFKKYLLTLEIDPMKVNSCYLGRRKQMITCQRNQGTIAEFTYGKTSTSNTQIEEVEISKITPFTTPPGATLLHSYERWLLVKNVIRTPLQVHYIFYRTETGEEYFRYSLDRNLFLEEIYDADALCAGVHLQHPPDNGANFNAATIFMNDNFCLFFQPSSAKVVRATLIWIEKKRIIPLRPEIQQILCSFSLITDLNYLAKEDGSCELRIEGEKDGKGVQIHLTAHSRNANSRDRFQIQT